MFRSRSAVLGVALGAIAFGLTQAASGASTATRWIVFSAVPGGTGPAQLFRVETTGANRKQVTTGKLPATQPAFSPDGKQIVFVRIGSGIFRVNLDGGGLKRLTSGTRDTFPVWSPDGKRVAFLRPYRRQWVVHVMSASGAGQHRLLEAPPSGRPSWSADGKALLLPTASDLSRVDARTGRVLSRLDVKTALTTSQAVTISPDVRFVAYVGPRTPTGPEDCGDGPCPQFGLYLDRVGHSRPRRIANDTGPAGWSPDGKTLAFVAHGRLILRAPDGGRRTTISTGADIPAADAPPAWQPR